MAVMTTYTFDAPLKQRRRPCSACCAMRRRLADALWYFCVLLTMDGVVQAFQWLFDTIPQHPMPQFTPMMDGKEPAPASNQSEQPRRPPSAPPPPVVDDNAETYPPYPPRDYDIIAEVHQENYEQ
jgi:hypothetical protein